MLLEKKTFRGFKNSLIKNEYFWDNNSIAIDLGNKRGWRQKKNFWPLLII